MEHFKDQAYKNGKSMGKREMTSGPLRSRQRIFAVITLVGATLITIALAELTLRVVIFSDTFKIPVFRKAYHYADAWVDVDFHKLG